MWSLVLPIYIAKNYVREAHFRDILEPSLTSNVELFEKIALNSFLDPQKAWYLIDIWYLDIWLSPD